MCIRDRIIAEREGVSNIRRRACEDILDMDFHKLTGNPAGKLKIALFREILNGKGAAEARQRHFMDMVQELSLIHI